MWKQFLVYVKAACWVSVSAVCGGNTAKHKKQTQVYHKHGCCSLRTLAMPLIVLSNKVFEQDFAHRSSFISFSEDTHWQCSMTLCWLQRMQHENNASVSVTKNTHYCIIHKQLMHTVPIHTLLHYHTNSKWSKHDKKSR